MMREAFERRGRDDAPMLSAIDGVTCLEPQGAFYCFPNVQGLLGRELARAHVATRRSSSPTSCSSEAKVAFVPGEAFGAPGYARFSFALGDDDLAEGISRIAKLVAGCGAVARLRDGATEEGRHPVGDRTIGRTRLLHAERSSLAAQRSGKRQLFVGDEVEDIPEQCLSTSMHLAWIHDVIPSAAPDQMSISSTSSVSCVVDDLAGPTNPSRP